MEDTRRIGTSARRRVLGLLTGIVLATAVTLVPHAAAASSSGGSQNVTGTATTPLPTVPPTAPPPTAPPPTSGPPSTFPPATAPPTATPTPQPTATSAPGVPTPVISQMQPTSGPPGTTVTLTGSNFSGPGYTVTSIMIGGVPAQFTTLSDGTLQFVIPTLPAGTATLTVTTSDGTNTVTSNPVSFTVTSGVAPGPTPASISGMQPSSGAPGDTITLNGGPFSGPGVSVTSVTVGGVPASFTVTSEGQLRFIVPNGLQPGPASVVISFKDGSHSVTAPGIVFTVVAPAAQSQGIIGGLLSWLSGVVGRPAALAIAALSLVLLLALLIFLVITILRRRRDEDSARDALDFGR